MAIDDASATGRAGTTVAVLEARGSRAGYGPQPVIHDLDLVVDPGEVVALLGANGAGKTTTLLGACGELPLLAGEVLLDGEVTTAPLHKRARSGPDVRHRGEVGVHGPVRRATTCGSRTSTSTPRSALFPELERRLDVRGGLLSGGEQQMLTSGPGAVPRAARAARRRAVDGPRAARRQAAARGRACAPPKQQGTAVLLVEQHVRKALGTPTAAYVMRRGRIELAARPIELRSAASREIEDRYLTRSALREEV